MEKKKIFKKILIYYFVTRIFLIFLMFFDGYLLSLKFPEIKSVFYLFDGEHYLNIARNGYIYNYLYAFFPAVPLLIKYLGNIPFLILNQICVLLTAYLIYVIGDEHLKLKDSYTAVRFWLISPISIMTMLFYTEALFIFLTVLVYYLYIKKRHYFILGILLGVGSLVRSTGSILFFFIIYYNDYRFSKKKNTI